MFHLSSGFFFPYYLDFLKDIWQLMFTWAVMDFVREHQCVTALVIGRHKPDHMGSKLCTWCFNLALQSKSDMKKAWLVTARQ